MIYTISLISLHKSVGQWNPLLYFMLRFLVPFSKSGFLLDLKQLILSTVYFWQCTSIFNALSKCLNSHLSSQITSYVLKLPSFTTLPSIGNSSHHCKKQLFSIVNKYFPQGNLRCIFVNRNTVVKSYSWCHQLLFINTLVVRVSLHILVNFNDIIS